MENALKRMNQSSNYANELMTTVAYLVSMIIPYAFGVYLSMRNIITIGTLMMISQLSNNFVNPLLFINQYINQIKTTKEIWKKCEAAVNEVSSKPKVVENTPKFANLMLTNGQFKIKDKTIFSDVSLQVNEHDKVLLMAPSGWGKSKLLSILTGENILSSGDYQLNEKDANGNWKYDHNFFAYVHQDPYIFNDTIVFNITLGKKVSQQELDNIVQVTELTDLIQKNGWDYQVGPTGVNLSGGQLQRIELAIAFVQKRPVLLADEATSALDNELSLKIHQNVIREYSGTIIEVAHKLLPEEKKLFTKEIHLDE